MYSITFAIIEFEIHETAFIFWQSKYILQKYYFGGGKKVMQVSYNERILNVFFIVKLKISHNAPCCSLCHCQRNEPQNWPL